MYFNGYRGNLTQILNWPTNVDVGKYSWKMSRFGSLSPPWIATCSCKSDLIKIEHSCFDFDVLNRKLWGLWKNNPIHGDKWWSIKIEPSTVTSFEIWKHVNTVVLIWCSSKYFMSICTFFQLMMTSWRVYNYFDTIQAIINMRIVRYPNFFTYFRSNLSIYTFNNCISKFYWLLPFNSIYNQR